MSCLPGGADLMSHKVIQGHWLQCITLSYSIGASDFIIVGQGARKWRVVFIPLKAKSS